MDKELQSLLGVLPELDFQKYELEQVRATVAELASAVPREKNQDVTESSLVVTGAPGDPPVRLCVFQPRSPDTQAPMVLHIHGGGFVLGSAGDSRAADILLASALGAIVVSVDYRLAPEARHPGPLYDCYAALEWMHANAATLGGDPSRIAVMGESAGGGLAASLALLAAERTHVAISHLHLIYPMLDDRTGRDVAPAPGAGEHVWTAQSNRFGWSSLLGDRSAEDAPVAAAARADDLQRLPDTFISVGSLDLFARENVDFAARLLSAGVNVELHVFPDAFHGFDLSPDADVAVRARAASFQAMKRALCAESRSQSR